MNQFVEAIQWLIDPANYTGSSTIPTRVLEHLAVTFLAVGIAAAIALPVGYLIGHTGKGRGLAVGFTGALRALPTLGLLSLVALLVGIGLTAPVVALVVLAIPPILAGAYSGLQAIDRVPIDAAKAMGMTPVQVFGKVEFPLSLPLVISGLRSAILQVVTTATLAAYIADFGLGRYIFRGLRTQDYPQMLGGSILILVVVLGLEAIFASLQRLTVPRGVRLGHTTNVTT